MGIHSQINIKGTATTVGDFWQWAYSDMLNNANRGVFAEFLVATALDALNQFRVQWDAVDIRYRGRRIEVKSAAYVQSWAQSKPSKIGFDIGEKLAWDAETNTYATLRQRSADCYVFCLFTETNRTLAHESVLNVAHWQFFALSTETINRDFAQTQRLSYKRLCTICDPTDYNTLKQRVDQILFKLGSSK